MVYCAAEGCGLLTLLDTILSFAILFYAALSKPIYSLSSPFATTPILSNLETLTPCDATFHFTFLYAPLHYSMLGYTVLRYT